MAEIVRLSEFEVLAIRKRMANTLLAKIDTFGLDQPLYPDKLSMAVERQNTSSKNTYKYKTLASVAATLFYGIAMDHPFENGNKRTALVTMLVLLHKNKYVVVNTSEDELYELARTVASHEIPIKSNIARNSESEVRAVSQWIRSRIKPIIIGDRILMFDEFKELLVAADCKFDNPDRNFIKIHRDGYSVKIGYPRRNFEIPIQDIKKVRKALHLDASHGLDSLGFYDIDNTVDKFIDRYRNLMNRLATL